MNCCGFAQSSQSNTYCNPLNIDYTYMIYNAYQNISYRSGADPAVVRFRGEYYMFVTRSLGYWHSTDLLNWQFIHPEKWYFQGSNAPAAHNYKDSVLYVMGDPSGQMSVLYTENPKKGDWKATPAILNDLQDPSLFIDDNDSAYLFWGSSNVYPIRAKTLNIHDRFKPGDSTYALFNLHGKKHGWERFGINHSDTVLSGYMEGPWLTKNNNKYYLQYAAPGTEFNVYGDGVYTADHPLGPYNYAPNNPVFYKPGGFITGAGHGSTVDGPQGLMWHFASMALSVNVNWERRLCMYPALFDNDGLMYSNTAFGDYPHYAPAYPGRPGEFTGWMLLSYNKPVKASSEKDGHVASNLADETVQTFWLAEENNYQQFVEIDLQQTATVYAIQVNYHDHKSNLYGKIDSLRHRYFIEGSIDGRKWTTLVDRKTSFKDVPNDYVELATPGMARFIRYNNIKVPTPNLSISGLRVFGVGSGKKPTAVTKVSVTRKPDRRDAILKWQAVAGAQGYHVYWGIAADKLYNSWQVYGKNELLIKSLSTDQTYFMAIEAFNENGVSPMSVVQHLP